VKSYVWKNFQHLIYSESSEHTGMFSAVIATDH